MLDGINQPIPGEFNLYLHDNHPQTELGSLYRDEVTEMHKDFTPLHVTCKLESLDNLLHKRIIPESATHVLKIDTEGHEHEVLRGAADVRRNPIE